MTRNFDWFNPNEHYVAQRYLHKPYLIDGLKFDLRVYVNLTCVTPLRIFMYNEGLARFATSEYNSSKTLVVHKNSERCNEGLARFATSEYNSPIGSNLNNLFMHLTNYAINKDAENFV